MTSRRFPPPWQVEQIDGGFKVLAAPGQALVVICALLDAFQHVSDKQHQICDEECTECVLADERNGHPGVASNQGHQSNHNGNNKRYLSWRADIHVFPPIGLYRGPTIALSQVAMQKLTLGVGVEFTNGGQPGVKLRR